MTNPPTVTKEQPGFAEQGRLSVEDAAQSPGRRDWLAGPQSGPSAGDPDPDEQVPYGDLKNNQTTHWKVQER